MQETVAIAALGVAATAIAGIVWLAKYLARELSRDLKEHTKAAIHQTEASISQTSASREAREASREVLQFMKNLNGKLENATIQKIAEQTVEHQTVNHLEK